MVVCLLIFALSGIPSSARAALQSNASTLLVSDSAGLWQSLIDQARSRGLPTKFLRSIDPRFVAIEFDDLHAYAAEYHPEEHRMVLNRTLSFNEAGGALKPLSKLTPQEIGTLYHELFHAYMDFLGSTVPLQGDPERLLSYARLLQQCRYAEVDITPIVQRKTHLERRFLSDQEAWEALNETWGVFVGWAAWTEAEILAGGDRKAGKNRGIDRNAFLKRLQKADRAGDLIGYYEPQDPAELAIARKRYLAPSEKISPDEAAILLEVVFEFSRKESRQAASAMEGALSFPSKASTCPRRNE